MAAAKYFEIGEVLDYVMASDVLSFEDMVRCSAVCRSWHHNIVAQSHSAQLTAFLPVQSPAPEPRLSSHSLIWPGVRLNTLIARLVKAYKQPQAEFLGMMRAMEMSNNPWTNGYAFISMHAGFSTITLYFYNPHPSEIRWYLVPHKLKAGPRGIRVGNVFQALQMLRGQGVYRIDIYPGF